MLVIGLTGGFGSGKSTVARRFSELGVPVLDADEIARELVAVGQPALAAIRRAFGTQVLDERGALDRRRLRAIVFRDPAQRRALEAILHPLIRREMERRMARIDAPYCVLCIPLLVEAGQLDLVDRVLVVDAPLEERRRRVFERDGLSDAEIAAVFAAQAGGEARLQAADDVIVNDRGLDALAGRVEQLHRAYLHAAADLP